MLVSSCEQKGIFNKTHLSFNELFFIHIYCLIIISHFIFLPKLILHFSCNSFQTFFITFVWGGISGSLSKFKGQSVNLNFFPPTSTEAVWFKLGHREQIVENCPTQYFQNGLESSCLFWHWKWGIPCSWYLHFFKNASVKAGVLWTKLMFNTSGTAKIGFEKKNKKIRCCKKSEKTITS